MLGAECLLKLHFRRRRRHDDNPVITIVTIVIIAGIVVIMCGMRYLLPCPCSAPAPRPSPASWDSPLPSLGREGGQKGLQFDEGAPKSE